MKLRNKVCIRCGKTYEPTGFTQKYCFECRCIVREEQRMAQYERRKEREYEAKEEDRLIERERKIMNHD